MELYLIRHGRPKTIQSENGEPADPPLSDQGHQQARHLCRGLAQMNIDRLYASPLKRARETATYFAESMGMELELDDGVQEFDHADPQYVPMEVLKKVDYKKWQAMMQGDFGSHINFESFADRVVRTLETIITENPGRRVAVVCHAGVINAFASHVIGFTPKMFFLPEYTSINVFQASRSGVRSVVSLNESCHLRP